MPASTGVLESLVAVAPGVHLALGGVAIVVGEAFIGKIDRRWLVSVGLLCTMMGLLFTLLLWEPAQVRSFRAFQGLATVDSLALFGGGVILLCAATTLISSVEHLRRFGLDRGEFYGLVLFAALGLWIMVATTNLFVVFLGLEVASIALYTLAGYYRTTDRSVEASLKYLLTGAFASSILLYGIALYYLGTGSVDLVTAGGNVAAAEVRPGVLPLALGLMLVGMGFKVAAVPFHMWAPDVYEGAPSTVTGFMATAVKAAGFCVILRILGTGFPQGLALATSALFWLATLTILVANVVAVVQRSVKRMMAYSSVAHAGYALLGIYALARGGEAGEAGTMAVIFYLPAYAVATLGAFTVISFLEEKEGRGLDFEDYAGLYRRYPGLALAMAIFLLSLGGIPPTAGFLAKYHVLGAVIGTGLEGGGLAPFLLAGVGILGSLIGLYYYLRVIVFMYMHEPRDDGRTFRLPGPGVSVAVFGTALLVLWLGLGPAVGFGADDVLRWARLAIPGG